MLPRCEPYPFASYFPRDTSPTALDLLSKMLVFDPAARVTVEWPDGTVTGPHPVEADRTVTLDRAALPG